MKPAMEFEKEALQTIDRIAEKGREKELEWFWNILREHFSQEYLLQQTPDLVVIGTDVPLELIRTLSKQPFYILGGSLEAAHWVDEKTPRDMDHVNQSSLGWILNPYFNISEHAIIITTNASDSRKKMVSLLREEGKNVIVLDVFPDANNSNTAAKHYQRQLEKMIEGIEDHTGITLSRKKLIQESRNVRQAKTSWEQYRSIVKKQKQPMSFEITTALMQSMYYAKDLNEWNWHLQMLINEMKKETERLCRVSDKPRIMILGSPVIFPNMKLTQLAEDAGMEICCMGDSFSSQFEAVPRRIFKTGSLQQDLKRLALHQVTHDASGATVRNTVLQSNLRNALDQYYMEGILVHILKGQIEYDFELAAVEAIAEQRNLPVFRLETDYQYQDVEQLRIRMEAFSEMLRQRRMAERNAL